MVLAQDDQRKILYLASKKEVTLAHALQDKMAAVDLDYNTNTNMLESTILDNLALSIGVTQVLVVVVVVVVEVVVVGRKEPVWVGQEHSEDEVQGWIVHSI